MKIGMVGLGRMGGPMTARLRQGGVEVVGYALEIDCGRDVDSLEDLVRALAPPRRLWLMLPPGPPTDSTIARLAQLLTPGDLVVDGGNSPYQMAATHAAALGTGGIGFLDAGVSGGVLGAEGGYAIMVGGQADLVAQLAPVFDALKPPGRHGFVHAGPVGAGHFAKMVHNGILFGVMQAMGEGYAVLRASQLVDDADGVVESWQEGTVIRSWLVELLAQALRADPGLAAVAAAPQHQDEAGWMLEAALELGLALPVTAAAQCSLVDTEDSNHSVVKVIAALRAIFGGGAPAGLPER